MVTWYAPGDSGAVPHGSDDALPPPPVRRVVAQPEWAQPSVPPPGPVMPFAPQPEGGAHPVPPDGAPDDGAPPDDPRAARLQMLMAMMRPAMALMRDVQAVGRQMGGG